MVENNITKWSDLWLHIDRETTAHGKYALMHTHIHIYGREKRQEQIKTTKEGRKDVVEHIRGG